MTLPAGFLRVRRSLFAAAITSVLVWSAATALAASSILSLWQLPGAVRLGLALAAAAAVAAGVTWRWRRVRDPRRVALWLEERSPALQYALVTRLEPRHAPLAGVLDRQIADAGDPVVGIAPGTLVLPLIVLLLTAGAWLITPRLEASIRQAVGAAPGVNGLPAGPGADPFAGFTARVDPPAYSGQRASVLPDPETIRALTGSVVTIGGRGSSAGITAELAGTLLAVSGERWGARFTIGPSPAALRLRHAAMGLERVVVVEPVADEVPRVTLESPRRDTTVRVAPASIPLLATAHDDIGLGEAFFEYTITSGSGEIFTARTGVVSHRLAGGARSTRIEGALPARQLQLRPGDLLSIRAVARDGNMLSGPGVGSSETRTIRVARADEYDSLAIEAMGPLLADSAFLSQRMILRLTEELVRVVPSLDRDSIVARSTGLARDQERLRDRVHEIVFPGHVHTDDEQWLEGEPPDHAEPADPVNVDLKEAYDAMWEAARELRIASPQTALLPMRVALAALDRARLADRVYLRGGTARTVVDVERVRLAGTERGSSSARSARLPADTLLRSLAAQLEALALARHLAPAARANALSELRVRLLTVNAAAAEALARASAALRVGQDPASALAEARRELGGAASARGPVPWSGW